MQDPNISVKPGKFFPEVLPFGTVGSMISPEVRIVGTSLAYAATINAAIGRVASERMYPGSPHPFNLDETKAFLALLKKHNGVQFVAIDENDEIVGWCDVLPRAYEGMQHAGVLGMGVVKEYRGRGIGRRLLQNTIAASAQRGIEKIELEVFASNAGAIRMYESAGFVREGVRSKARMLDGTYEDNILMALHISAE